MFDDFAGWLWVIAIGGLAGWLAGGMMRGGGYGIFGNVVLGVIWRIGGPVVTRTAQRRPF